MGGPDQCRVGGRVRLLGQCRHDQAASSPPTVRGGVTIRRSGGLGNGPWRGGSARMTDRPSPRDRLRKANPIDAQAMPSSDAPEAHALLERIVRSDGDSLVVRPRRRRRWLLILVPIAIGAALAAGYGFFRDVRQPHIVACYPRASLAAGPAVVSVGTGIPVEACAFLWKPSGAFHARAAEGIPA